MYFNKKSNSTNCDILYNIKPLKYMPEDCLTSMKIFLNQNSA